MRAVVKLREPWQGCDLVRGEVDEARLMTRGWVVVSGGVERRVTSGAGDWVGTGVEEMLWPIASVVWVRPEGEDGEAT